MDLIGRLLSLANLWTSANDRSLSRLATMVANDGKLFDRLNAGATCTVTTFERFVHFLNDASNWRDGVPSEARVLLDSVLMESAHVDGHTAAETIGAPGKIGEISTNQERVA